jgi:hypothetical protein
MPGTTTFKGIPIMWVAPEKMSASTRLVVWLASASNEMETVRPELDRLANEDYLAISFDSWGPGAARSRSRSALIF